MFFQFHATLSKLQPYNGFSSNERSALRAPPVPIHVSSCSRRTCRVYAKWSSIRWVSSLQSHRGHAIWVVTICRWDDNCEWEIVGYYLEHQCNVTEALRWHRAYLWFFFKSKIIEVNLNDMFLEVVASFLSCGISSIPFV